MEPTPFPETPEFPGLPITQALVDKATGALNESMTVASVGTKAVERARDKTTFFGALTSIGGGIVSCFGRSPRSEFIDSSRSVQWGWR